VRQQRQKAKIYPAASDIPLAEWSLDEVWLGATNKAASATQADKRDGKSLFHELEIELLAPEGSNEADVIPGDRQASFERLVRQVSERYALTPIYSSKFVRGLEAQIAHIHGATHVSAHALTPTMTLAQAGRLLLHQQLFQIVLHEHEVRKDTGSRYVHDMRVAIRRARAALQLCHESSSEKALLPIIKGLKRLGRALGHVRDLDVALANLRAFRHDQPTELHKGIQLLRAELKSQRVDARADLVRLLDSKKHRKFIAEALRFCITKSTTEDQGKHAAKGNRDAYDVVPVQVRHTLPSRILAAFEAVRAYETAFSKGDLPPLETFHALRIQAKHLRYVVEFAQHLLGEEGAALAQELRAHQEFLGELNDAHVEQLRLQHWAEKTPPDSLLLRAIETRLRNTNAAIDRLTSGTPAALAKLINYQSRLTLTKALAQL
jgi:CHAD domain-containing protein